MAKCESCGNSLTEVRTRGVVMTDGSARDVLKGGYYRVETTFSTNIDLCDTCASVLKDKVRNAVGSMVFFGKK